MVTKAMVDTDEELREALAAAERQVAELKRANAALEALAAEQRRAQDALIAAQKAESLSVLAGGVAHDFNNLLGAVIGHAMLAQRKLPEASPLRRHLDAVLESAERAAELSGQMLAYSGRRHMKLEAVDVARLLEDESALLAAGVPKRVRLLVDLPAAPLRVHADAGQLQQALASLVLNAAEACEARGGEVHVAVGELRLEAGDASYTRFTGEPLAPGRYAALTVADDGAGMSEATLARAFDPFFSTKFTGRGLGLPAVLGIVRAHGGGIAVETRPGAGSVFEIVLPLEPEAGAPAAPRPVTGPPSARAILVVDDEPTIREVAVELLALEGYETLGAGSVAEALALAGRHRDRIGLLLLDLSMPDGGGLAVLEGVRPVLPQARVILSSGYSAEDAAEAIEQGRAAAFLHKPYRADELVSLVRSLLD